MAIKKSNVISTLYKRRTYKEVLQTHVDKLEESCNIDMLSMCVIGITKEGPMFSVLEYGCLVELLGAIDIAKHTLMNMLGSDYTILNDKKDE